MSRVAHRPVFWIALLLVTGSLSCDDQERRWYNVLKADQAAYEAITDEIAERYEAGAISEERMAVYAEMGQRWGVAHNQAVQALLFYRHSKGKPAKDTVVLALLEVATALHELEVAWQQEPGGTP